jgi:hypothetical protein
MIPAGMQLTSLQTRKRASFLVGMIVRARMISGRVIETRSTPEFQKNRVLKPLQVTVGYRQDWGGDCIHDPANKDSEGVSR